MIIIDYNGIAIANIMVQKLAIDENIIRHMILNSIRTELGSIKTMAKLYYVQMQAATGARKYFHNIKQHVRKQEINHLLIGMKYFVLLLWYVKRYVKTFHTKLCISKVVKQMTALHSL